MTLSDEVRKRAKQVRLVVFDVDGVLTDGGVIVDDNGVETKRFHVHDGAAMRYLARSGFRVAWLSGRGCEAVARRAEELGVEEVHQDAHEKLPVLEKMIAGGGSMDAVCFMGDDFPDLPIMRRVGFAVAPAGARPEVLEVAHYVTSSRGGNGAARELAELLIREQGKWDVIFARYR